MNLYEDSSNMIEHLKTIYNDLNWVTIAKNQFQQLYIKNTDWFHNFLSEFLYLATEASVSNNDLKDELYHQIMTKLQELTMPEINSDDTFQQFTFFCFQTVSCLKIINYCIQKNWQYTSSQRCTGSSSMNATVKKELNTFLPSTIYLQKADWMQLMHEGKCFNCQEQGHLSTDCPKKQKSELKELEQPKELPMEQNQNDLENA